MNTYIVELERKEHYDNGYDDYRFRDEGSNMVVIGEERAVEILNEFWGELFSYTFERMHQDNMYFHYNADYRDFETDKQAEADSWYCILRSEDVPYYLQASYDFQKNVMFDPKHYQNSLGYVEGYSRDQYVTALEENYDTLKEMWEALKSRTFSSDDLPVTKKGRAKSRWIQGKVSAGNQSMTTDCRIKVTAVGEPTERSAFQLESDEEYEAWMAWKNDPKAQAEEKERKQRLAEIRTTMGEMGHNCMSYNGDGSVSHWRE